MDKPTNILFGLTKANEWIARDEGIHTSFAVAFYSLLCGKMKKFDRLSEARVVEIITSAVTVNEVFTRGAMNVHLVGLSADEMMNYVKCTADHLSSSLGYRSIFGAQNPFNWMAIISLPNKTNFFESKPSEYARPKNDDEDLLSYDEDVKF